MEKTRSQHKQLRNGKSWRDSLPQGCPQQLVIQYQLLSPENTHTHIKHILKVCEYSYKSDRLPANLRKLL